ncbi:MAG: ATP-binding protein, partial [Acidobacteria bacterium]|nr:ATP-binding protein [Acidobacteriota bacterium]
MAKTDCTQCEGTGWKPVETDGVRRMVPCDCVEGERTVRLLARARVPRRYEHCDFESFDIRKDASGEPNRYLERAKIEAMAFVREYPLDYGLLFVGPTGVGKTHLGVAVLRDLMISKGVECLFYDFRDLLKEIQDSWNPVSRSSELRVLQPVLDSEVLLLDELAALNPTDWVKETLAYIINTRYNQKKVTLITTTLPFGDSGGRREARMPSGESVPDVERTLNQFG